MSRENVGVVKRAYAAWNRDDMDTLLELINDSLEWTPVFGAAGLGATTYRGRAEFLAWKRETRETLGHTSVEPREFRDGEAGIVVPVRVTGRGAGSGIEISEFFFHVWGVAEGKITQLQSFEREQDALEAAGIEPATPS